MYLKENCSPVTVSPVQDPFPLPDTHFTCQQLKYFELLKLFMPCIFLPCGFNLQGSGLLMQRQASPGRRGREMEVAALPPVGRPPCPASGQPDRARAPRTPVRRQNKPLNPAA